MTAALPTHVVTVDEPIPPLSEHALVNEPDTRAVTPLEVMLAELAHVAADDTAFVAQFRAYVREIGCTLMAHYDRHGDLALSLGAPIDGCERQRSRFATHLFGRLDSVEGRRVLLLRQLLDERACLDERPDGRREVTAAEGEVLA